MKLPRRVPWASLAELDQLCSWIYDDENDIEAKVAAVNRMAAWKVITTVPHAIDSALAILVVIVQDTQQHGCTNYLSLRQSYATSILRLVNGLVDPLQVGTYARPIASIAKQLGLPAWLVELRHAATHEDLPSLDLLREAAHQSMSWLLHNYFLPILNPNDAQVNPSPTPLRPLAPILKKYKSVMKTITRDASLVTSYKPLLTALFRDVERWISEGKVAANMAIGEVGWASSSNVEGDVADADPKEIWALETFVDLLAEKGTMVPLSKKKRQNADEEQRPSKALVALWNPLLQHIFSFHPLLPSVMVKRLVSILLRTSSPMDESSKPDPTYGACISHWILWTVDTWQDSVSEGSDIRKDALLSLLLGVGPDMSQSEKTVRSLVKILAAQDSQINGAVDVLLQRGSTDHKDWQSDDLAVMADRLKSLQSGQPLEDEVMADIPKAQPSPTKYVIPGWRKLEEGINWKPCPIGIYYTG